MVCPGLKLMRDGGPCTECVGNGLLPALRHRCHKDSLAATGARVAGMWLHDVMGVYDLVDLFVTPSRFMADLLIEAGFDASRVTHIPSFYPAGPNGQDTTESSDPYILYFGRLAPEKGIDCLLEAHARLANPPRLIIAGADTLGCGEGLQALAERLGTGRVEFVGFQQPEALSGLIAGCMFTVVPSVWPDNCPMSVLESFAHSKPVVGTRTGGLPEQIADGCGVLAEPGDVADLAGAIDRLSSDARLRSEMGSAARERLDAVYSPDAHAGELVGRLSLATGLTNNSDDSARITSADEPPVAASQSLDERRAGSAGGV